MFHSWNRLGLLLWSILCTFRMSTPQQSDKRLTRQKSLMEKPKLDKASKTVVGSQGSTKKPKKPKPTTKVRSDSPYLPRKPKPEPVKTEHDSEEGSSGNRKLTILSPEIKIHDDLPLTALEELYSSSSESTEIVKTSSDDLAELNSDELEDDSVAPLTIPDNIRTEVGANWRLKEALLNSYYFGKATMRSIDFSRSQSEIKTAQVLADPSHSLESKKFYVKIHLGTVNHTLFCCTLLFF